MFSETRKKSIVNFSSSPKNGYRFQVTLKVDKVSYDNALRNGYIIVGYDCYTVNDGVELHRCFNCCGYHHMAKQCSQRGETCPRCAGNHSVKDCKSETFKCVICCSYNAKHDDKILFEHAAWKFANYATYRKALSDFKSNILNFQ